MPGDSWEARAVLGVVVEPFYLVVLIYTNVKSEAVWHSFAQATATFLTPRFNIR